MFLSYRYKKTHYGKFKRKKQLPIVVKIPYLESIRLFPVMVVHFAFISDA